jgi:hypothetical protein
VSCAADILTALNGAKPTSTGGITAYLQTLSANITQAVITYISSSVTTACAYTGAATAAGTGTFTVLTASLMSAQLLAGFNATSDVNNKIAEGFAKGLHAILIAGTVTETATGVTVPAGTPITFTAVGSAHTASVPVFSACAAALGRMTTEKPSEGENMNTMEQNKLKLMANSFAKIIDDFIPTITINTIGGGSAGTGSAAASVPAVDPSFPA